MKYIIDGRLVSVPDETAEICYVIDVFAANAGTKEEIFNGKIPISLRKYKYLRVDMCLQVELYDASGVYTLFYAYVELLNPDTGNGVVPAYYFFKDPDKAKNGYLTASAMGVISVGAYKPSELKVYVKSDTSKVRSINPSDVPVGFYVDSFVNVRAFNGYLDNNINPK